MSFIRLHVWIRLSALALVLLQTDRALAATLRPPTADGAYIPEVACPGPERPAERSSSPSRHSISRPSRSRKSRETSLASFPATGVTAIPSTGFGMRFVRTVREVTRSFDSDTPHTIFVHDGFSWGFDGFCNVPEPNMLFIALPLLMLWLGRCSAREAMSPTNRRINGSRHADRL